MQEATQLKKRKKVKKIPNVTFTPSRNRKSPTKILQPQVDFSFEMEEKPFLEEEHLAEIPDDELQQIPEESYQIINDGIEEFSKILYFAVEGERRRSEMKSQDTPTFDVMIHEASGDSIKGSQSDLKADQFPMKTETSHALQKLIAPKNEDESSEVYADESQCNLDDQTLREIIWKLNWFHDLVFKDRNI